MKRLFTEHPESVGETYVQHLAMASGFGWRMCMAGIACLLHGIFPFWFKSTGSETICTLHDRMVRHRTGHKADDRSLPADTSGLKVQRLK